MSTSTSTTSEAAPPQRIVFFDGVCNLCDGVVKFLLQHDKQKVFTFCSLQSEAAQPYLARFGITPEDALKSILFVDGDKHYLKSSAALNIASYLPAPWSWLYVFNLMPAFLRDGAYDCVAANRYRMFGKNEEGTCLMRTSSIMARFLDANEGKKTKTSSTSSSSATEGSKKTK